MRSPLEPAQLQLALDVTDIEEAVAIAEEAIEYVDRLEVGTPLITSEGVSRSISALKARFPSVPLIADPKVMDRGGQVTRACIKAGASGIIVQAGAPFETLAAACEASMEAGAEICVDSLGIDTVPQVAERIGTLPFDYMILHRGKDEQAAGGGLAIEALHAAAETSGMPPLAIAGGIGPDNIGEFAQMPAVRVIIVGEAIASSRSPHTAAALMRRTCDRVRTPA